MATSAPPPYLAWYWRHFGLEVETCDTLDEAARYLWYGSGQGDLAVVGIEDTSTGEMVDASDLYRQFDLEEEAGIKAIPTRRYHLRLSDPARAGSAWIDGADDPADFAPWLERFGDRCEIVEVT